MYVCAHWLGLSQTSAEERLICMNCEFGIKKVRKFQSGQFS